MGVWQMWKYLSFIILFFEKNIFEVIDLFPMTGIVVGFISMIALWFVFSGWEMILLGMEDANHKWAIADFM